VPEMTRTYLDYAATAPLRPEARRAMAPLLGDAFGNPSSGHRLGLAAHDALQGARESVAKLIGAAPDEITFTSGGTEAINLALKGVALARQSEGHLVTTSIEHPATLETARFIGSCWGWPVTYLSVDPDGLLDPDSVRRAITPQTVLVSFMHANNEVGTIQPIREIGAIARERGALLHVDAVQSAGKIPVNVDELGADLLSLSAHKLGGPKGVGALYCRPGTPIAPLIHGGGQELGLRSGTENLPGVAGFGAAAEAAARELPATGARLAELGARLIDGILYSVEGVRITGHPTRRLPGFASFCFEALDGRWLVKELSRAGVFAATGSACSSDHMEPSHVLTAMGVRPEMARGALRLSMGWGTAVEEIQYAITTTPRAVERVRARTASGDDLEAEYAQDCRSARDRAVRGFVAGALARVMRRA
jgi:cysteine desulfurase